MEKQQIQLSRPHTSEPIAKPWLGAPAPAGGGVNGVFEPISWFCQLATGAGGAVHSADAAGCSNGALTAGWITVSGSSNGRGSAAAGFGASKGDDIGDGSPNCGVSATGSA